MQLNRLTAIFLISRVEFTRFFSSWLSVSLTRALLTDIGSAGQVTAYLGNLVLFNTLVTKRSNFGIACNITAVGLALCTPSPLPCRVLPWRCH